jgi:hypothetical protein
VCARVHLITFSYVALLVFVLTYHIYPCTNPSRSVLCLVCIILVIMVRCMLGGGFVLGSGGSCFIEGAQGAWSLIGIQCAIFMYVGLFVRDRVRFIVGSGRRWVLVALWSVAARLIWWMYIRFIEAANCSLGIVYSLRQQAIVSEFRATQPCKRQRRFSKRLVTWWSLAFTFSFTGCMLQAADT